MGSGGGGGGGSGSTRGGTRHAPDVHVAILQYCGGTLLAAARAHRRRCHDLVVAASTDLHTARILLRIQRLARVEKARDLIPQLPVLVATPSVHHTIGAERHRVRVARSAVRIRRAATVIAGLNARGLEAIARVAVTKPTPLTCEQQHGGDSSFGGGVSIRAWQQSRTSMWGGHAATREHAAR